MLKLGTKIYNAVLKSKPILIDGSPAISKRSIFSIKDPYILECLPESELEVLSRMEGKKLNTVCRVLDSPNYTQILQRFTRFCTGRGFSEIELKQLLKKAFNGNKAPNPLNSNLDAMLNLKLGDTGMLFDSHGISKVSIPEHLSQLNTLLTKGIDKTKNFYTAPLDIPDNIRAGAGAAMGTSSGCAVRDGSFIITSGKGKSLVNDGIENVIVNDAYYKIIDDLRARFPQINFIRADEATEYFSIL